MSSYYLAGDGLAWFVIALSLAWALWNIKYWASSASQIASIVHCLEFWVDKIWLSYLDGVPRSWPFNLLIIILGLVLVLGILNHLSSRDYFDGNPVKIS